MPLPEPTRAGLALPTGARVGIVAGGGTLPQDVSRALVAHGHKPFVLALDGEGNDAESFEGAEAQLATLEEIGRFIERMKRAGVTHVVLAGSVARRPRLGRIQWNLGLVRMIAALVPALRRGDDALLRASIRHFAQNGLAVVGAHEVVPGLVAEEGALTTARPRASDQRDIEAAVEAALAIGRLDIGQAAISVGGRAVALEGIEGTDGLLERMKVLRSHGRLAGRTRGVIAKVAKPGQDVRADLPAIGPETVSGAQAAGLAGIVVEAGRSLLLERDRTLAAANAAGLFVVAVPVRAGDRGA